MDAVRVAPVHRVGAQRERLSLAPAVRSVAGALAIHNVRRDGKDRLRVNGIAIGGILSQLARLEPLPRGIWLFTGDLMRSLGCHLLVLLPFAFGSSESQ